MNKSEVVEYHSTVGLMVWVPQVKKNLLVKIAHDKLSDGSWKVYVESGNNLSQIKRCGTKYLSHDVVQDCFDNDDITKFRNLASLFDIEA